MDERLRMFERAAREGDPLMASRALRDSLRSGLIPLERLELAAHLGDETARLALDRAEPFKVPEGPEEATAWWRGLARFGRDVGVRAGIALARPFLCENHYGDRFSGIAEQAWAAIESLEGWVKEPTDERLAAAQTAIQTALEMEQPAAGVGIVPAIASLITASPFDEALVLFGEQTHPRRRYYHEAEPSFETTLARIRRDVVPWALGERDPLETRHEVEGRHFGVDPDISRSVSFSRDGRYVLSSSRSGCCRVREAESGAILRDFERVRGEVFAAAFSPDASLVLAAGQWRPTRLLAVTSGVELRSFEHGEEVRAVAFVDGKRAVTGSDDHTIKLWDVETGAELRTFTGHERGVSELAVTPRGRLVSASSDETVRLWDLETGEALSVWKQPASIESLALAPDGAHVLVGHGDGRVRLVSLASGEEIRVFKGEHGAIYGVAFAPDGRTFVAVRSGWKTAMTLWDVATGVVLRSWDSFHAVTFHVAFAPDGGRFVTGDREGGLRVYSLVTGHLSLVTGH